MSIPRLTKGPLGSLLVALLVVPFPAIALDSSESSSQVSHRPWFLLEERVKCGEGHYCQPAVAPVCCHESKSCVPGGYQCCPQNSRGCPKDYTCCNTNCCGPNESCQSGTCVADNKCRELKKEECSVNGCRWCCADNTCSSTESECSREENCDPCLQHTTCSDCLLSKGCGWCCTTQRCMSNNNKEQGLYHDKWCNPYSFIGNMTYGNRHILGNTDCTACSEGGLGVVTERVDDLSEIAWVIVTVLLICCCLICSCLTVRCLLGYLAKSNRQSRTHFDPFADGHPQRDIDTEDDSTFVPKVIKKYGFGTPVDTLDEAPDVHSPRAGEMEGESCVVCFDGGQDVMFLPCQHRCCCRTCSLKLERDHNSKIQRRRQVVEVSSAGCPLCRNEIETMVCFESESAGPHADTHLDVEVEEEARAQGSAESTHEGATPEARSGDGDDEVHIDIGSDQEPIEGPVSGSGEETADRTHEESPSPTPEEREREDRRPNEPYDEQ